MRLIRFWGTRGSIPVALTATDVRARIATALRAASGRGLTSGAEIDDYLRTLPFEVVGTYGGHTSCVEIETGSSDYVLCDLGTGVRAFGQAAIARHGPATPQTYHVFLSHVHWDHIMGLPFFTPAYIPGNRIVFYGGHSDLESALRRQMDPPSFPVDFSLLRADIEFVRMTPGIGYDVAGAIVTAKLQHHAGDSYGYRFEGNGKVVVYSTDSEHKLDNAAEVEEFADFFRNADVVIFDAMYSLADAVSVKADWGHSSNVVAVELCQLAEVRHLCLFHHEPAHDDVAIGKMLAEARRLEEITRTGGPLRVSAAYDGLEIVL
ncbi:MAG: MBL fold metallo-hydrolase [Gemmatimonas sp.]